MKNLTLRPLQSIALLALALLACAAYAAEHHEHPGTHEQEHPTERAAGPAVTPNQIASAITNYVNADSKLKGGYFLVYDAKKKEPLALSLVRIHKEKITPLSDDLSFVCADFKTPSGKMYDLDFFVSHQGTRNLQVSQITIHKEAGVPRYNWVKKGSKWVRE